MKGSYVLLVKIDRDILIGIGRLGNICFKKGYYAYVGSAMNSLEKRINRHLRSEKKMHWHVDYLLKCADVVDVFYMESNSSEECKIARHFGSMFECIYGFGCSDCKCDSHLFYGSYNRFLAVLKNLEFKVF